MDGREHYERGEFWTAQAEEDMRTNQAAFGCTAYLGHLHFLAAIAHSRLNPQREPVRPQPKRPAPASATRTE
jgi:hypothetical protein